MGGKKKDTDDWLAGIADDLKGIKDGPNVILEWLENKFGPMLTALDELVKEIRKGKVTYEGGKAGFWGGGLLGGRGG
jgi:hypothetical protein